MFGSDLFATGGRKIHAAVVAVADASAQQISLFLSSPPLASGVSKMYRDPDAMPASAIVH